MHYPSRLLEVRKFDVLHLHTPLLAVLIHEGREHLVVEAAHAFTTDFETFALEFGSLLGVHDLESYFLAYHISKSITSILAMNYLSISVNYKVLEVIILISVVDVHYSASILGWLRYANSLNEVRQVVSLSLLFTFGPCDDIIAFFCSITEHTLHSKLVPVLVERSVRNAFVIRFGHSGVFITQSIKLRLILLAPLRREYIFSILLFHSTIK